MYNINSPIIQDLIRKTPSGGLGNMQFYNGPAPRVETVEIPSSALSGVSSMPYPDPYNMITGIGMNNYGMPPSIPISPGGGIINGIYQDASQPMYQQPNLPIQNYYNPYMGVGTSFGTGYYNPIVQPAYVDPDDLLAQSQGFMNAAEKLINDFNVYKMIAKASYIGCGYSKEEIDKFMEEKDKELEKAMEDFKKRKSNNPNNPISFNSYNQPKAAKSTMKVSIVKGDKVLASYDPATSMPSYYNPNAVNVILMNEEINKRTELVRQANMAYMYANAVERQLDNEDSIEFFNHGINLVHHRDKEMEWEKMSRNSKRLYDSEEFKRRLAEEHGTPQDKIRYRRDKARRDAIAKKKAEEEKKRGTIIKGSDLPEGLLPFNAEAAAAMEFTENGLHITVPDWIRKAHDKPILKDTEAYKEYEKEMENIDNKIDAFLEEYASPKPITPSLFSMQQPRAMNTLTGYAPGNDFMKHYYTTRDAFMREVSKI